MVAAFAAENGLAKIVGKKLQAGLLPVSPSSFHLDTF
jgi:hypothetical protein